MRNRTSAKLGEGEGKRPSALPQLSLGRGERPLSPSPSFAAG